MSEKKHVVVVCGYGCHLDTPLKPYLDRFIKFLDEYKPNYIVYCGGQTQKKTAGNISEATVMSRYVVAQAELRQFKKLPPLHFAPWFNETDSYTTHDNIKKAGEEIRRCCEAEVKVAEEISKVRITIFCEAHRAPSVIMLARHFMADLIEDLADIKVETDSWELADPFKQVRNLVYNKLAITYPWLGLAERERKKRLAKSKQI